MAKLYLHIGTPKTGSTSIQHFLSHNRKRLAASGYSLLKFGKYANNVEIPLMVSVPKTDVVDPDFRRLRIITSPSRDSAITRWKAQLSREVKRGNSNSWIISSELIRERLVEVEDIVRLKELLEDLFEEILVIVYLRKPISSAIALWSTQVKLGSTDRKLPSPTSPEINSLCNHQATLEKWGSVFGIDKIVPRIFERAAFHNGDLMEDFQEVCELSGVAMEKLEFANRALSYDALLVLAQLNERIPQFLPDGSVNPAQEHLFLAIQEVFPDSKPYKPTYEEYVAYEETFSKSEEWVRENFFPERESLFSLSSSLAQKPGQLSPNVPEMDGRVLDLIAKLWVEHESAKSLAKRLANPFKQFWHNLLS